MADSEYRTFDGILLKQYFGYWFILLFVCCGQICAGIFLFFNPSYVAVGDLNDNYNDIVKYTKEQILYNDTSGNDLSKGANVSSVLRPVPVLAMIFILFGIWTIIASTAGLYIPTRKKFSSFTRCTGVYFVNILLITMTITAVGIAACVLLGMDLGKVAVNGKDYYSIISNLKRAMAETSQTVHYSNFSITDHPLKGPGEKDYSISFTRYIIHTELTVKEWKTDMSKLQSKWKCCGIHGYNDWMAPPYGLPVAPSTCKGDTLSNIIIDDNGLVSGYTRSSYSKLSTESGYFESGCLEKLSNLASNNIKLCYGVIIGLAFIIVMLNIIGICIVCRIKLIFKNKAGEDGDLPGTELWVNPDWGTRMTARNRWQF